MRIRGVASKYNDRPTPRSCPRMPLHTHTCHKVSVHLPPPPNKTGRARRRALAGRCVPAPYHPQSHTYLVKGVLDGHHWVLGKELLVQIRELSTRQLLAAVVAGGLEVEVVLLSNGSMRFGTRDSGGVVSFSCCDGLVYLLGYLHW